MNPEIPEMKTNYDGKKVPVNADIPEDVKKEMEKTRKELDELKGFILKKYNFTLAIGIIPPQASEKIEEEEEIPEEECEKKPVHLLIIIPEDQFKNLTKIKTEIVKQSKSIKQNLWVHVKTPVDIFNWCLDSKFDIYSAVAMSFPLYDKGFLGALRLAEIHKSLVLQKFEKYITSYVLGGSIVRGTATKTSDVDVFVIIDDTDVKRMPRLELKEKLRAIIYNYIGEASALAGAKNPLNVQPYILTEFWESVKDAHPVMFTFIRDGIPLYDKGTFLPWKLLLKMGKLKPSPEAIDMFMASGDKVSEIAKRRLLDIAVIDLYWGVLTPSQAMLMLHGLPPPTHKETPHVFRETFVTKEKLLEKKYADTLEKIINLYRDYEHEKVKEIKGAELDVLIKEADAFMKRLKELRVQIEKRSQEKTIEQVYADLIKLLKAIFGDKAQKALENEFEKKLIETGKVPPAYSRILKSVFQAREDFKKNKLKKHEVEEARKNALLLTNSLIEYSQRCELIAVDKGRMEIIYGKQRDKKAELLITAKQAFLVRDGKIERVDKDTGKVTESNPDEMNDEINKSRGKTTAKLDSELLTALKDKLGEFDVLL